MLGNPRPSYGLTRNHGFEGRIDYGRLGGLGIDPNYPNFYTTQ